MQSYRNKGVVDLPPDTAVGVSSGSKGAGPVRYATRQPFPLSDSEDELDDDSDSDSESEPEMNYAKRRDRATGPQNVEQEYQKWVTGDLTDIDINLLAYWEVKSQEYICTISTDIST